MLLWCFCFTFQNPGVKPEKQKHKKQQRWERKGSGMRLPLDAQPSVDMEWKLVSMQPVGGKCRVGKLTPQPSIPEGQIVVHRVINYYRQKGIFLSIQTLGDSHHTF